MELKQTEFSEKVRLSNEACQRGDYIQAIKLYSEALELDGNNYIIYSNRSAAYLKLGKFELALRDADHAHKLCPSWPKAYYRQGVALQCLGRFCESFIAFGKGLSYDSSSKQLLNALKEAAVKSPLKINGFDSVLEHVNCANGNSAFILVTVIAQEMLAAKYVEEAADLLQIALKIDNDLPKLQASVFSTLSSAFWSLGQFEKSIEYIKEDLKIGQNFCDETIEIRAFGNLGSAYVNQAKYVDGIWAYQQQYEIADRVKNLDVSLAALSSLGNVYKTIRDYGNAVKTHELICELHRRNGKQLDEAKQYVVIANLLMATNEFSRAVEYYSKHLKMALHLGNEREEAKAYCNLAFCYQQQRKYKEAVVYFESVLKILKAHGDDAMECRVYAGLGHAYRCLGQLSEAKIWYEKQLEKSLRRCDRVSEGSALSNLGILYQTLNDYESAVKLHQAHLSIARATNDRAAMGRAFGNIGNVYLSLGKYNEAVQHHKEELMISKETKDKNAEAATHGNLAIAYQSLKITDMALLHYRAHLDIAKEIKDIGAETCALLNLANFLSSRCQFDEAKPYYEQYLMLAQEMADVEGESKACHFLGYVHYCLKNYREAVRYYNQDLVLVKDMKNSDSIARAYCNLGLAYLALGQFQQALDCQKNFLSINEALTDSTVVVNNKFRAFGNIGDVLMKMQRSDEALKMYHSQWNLARSVRNLEMEVQACATLGFAYKAQKAYNKALNFHKQELTIRQEMKSVREECVAYNNIGNVYIMLNDYQSAIDCYQDQLTKCLNELHDSELEAETYGNLAVAQTCLGHYSEAVKYFEKQLTSMQLSSSVGISSKEFAKVFNYLGLCYDKMADYDQSLKYYEQFLKAAQNSANRSDEEKAYINMAAVWKKIKSYAQMLVCLEKRLVISHQLDNVDKKIAAYSDLGNAHYLTKNFSQAILCYQNQYELARSSSNVKCEADACANLGNIYYANQDYQTALRYYEIELNLSRKIADAVEEANALQNISKTYEGMRNYEEALRCQEMFWKKIELTDTPAVSVRLECVIAMARLCDRLGNEQLSIAYLNEALELAVNAASEHERFETVIAEVYFRFGLIYEKRNEYEVSVQYFEKCAQLFENAARFENPLLLMTYRALQKLYCLTKQTDESLLMAEKCRSVSCPVENPCVKVSEFKKFLVNQKQYVIYYNVSENYLYRYFIKPLDDSSIVQEFSQVALRENGLNFEDDLLLEINTHANKLDSYLKSLFDEANMRDKLEDNFKRNTLLNSSNYSLSSLFSVGSISGLSTKNSPYLKTGVSAHYHNNTVTADKYLEAVIEDLRRILFPDDLETSLNSISQMSTTKKPDLILVLEKQLVLVPFQSFWLYDRVNLVTVTDFRHVEQMKVRNRVDGKTKASVFIVAADYKTNPIVKTIRDVFECNREDKSLLVLDRSCRKMDFKRGLQSAESAAFVSVQVLSNKMAFEFQGSKLNSSSSESLSVSNDGDDDDEDDANVGNDSKYKTDLELLTFNELSQMNLFQLKLAVIHNDFDDVTITSAAAIIEAFLRAGCGSVVMLLWPVPEVVLKIFYRTFFTALLQGTRTYRAHQEAVQVIRHTKQFSDAVYWAGFVLIGANIRVSKNIPLQGRAIYDVIMDGDDKYKETFRVLLHLIEKSLQRINRGQRNAMYTTERSIENKMAKDKRGQHDAEKINTEETAWKIILKSVGFRFEPSPTKHVASNNSIFFPQSDPEDRLAQTSASLQAILSLNPCLLSALRLLIAHNRERIFDVIDLFRTLAEVTHFATYKLTLSAELWAMHGCHELLAAIGFELAHVHEDKIVLAAGKAVLRNQIGFVLQTLLAIFDTFEAPKNLLINENDRGEPDGGFENDNSQQQLITRKLSTEISQKFDKFCIDDKKKDEMQIFELFNEFRAVASSGKLIAPVHNENQCAYQRDDGDGKSLYEKRSSS